MKALLDPQVLQAGMGNLLGPVFFGLIGLAFAQDAPGSWVVDTGGFEVPIGDLTLPAAMVVFGRMIERAAKALVNWRPGFELVLQHRHVQVSEVGEGAPGPAEG